MVADKLSVSGSAVMIGSKPTLISARKHSTGGKFIDLRFLVMDAPRPSNVHLYIRECRKHSVTDIVRVCEATYPRSEFESAGIILHEMPYPDGHSPPRDILDRWLTLVDERFVKKISRGEVSMKEEDNLVISLEDRVHSRNYPSSYCNEICHYMSGANGEVEVTGSPVFTPTIAVHCVAGLGRAPVLVAIALVEFTDMDPVEAVALIRSHRRGSINEKQLNWLDQYRRSYKWENAIVGKSCCIIL